MRIYLQRFAAKVACTMAMKMCLDLNIKRLEVEGDSRTRLANRAAHRLATEGFKQKIEIILMNDGQNFQR
ncbi:hypothetical protein Gotur_003475 [Gossypium turneri]